MNKFRLLAHFLQLFYTPYDRNTIAKSPYKRATSSIYSRHKLQKTHHKRSLIIVYIPMVSKECFRFLPYLPLSTRRGTPLLP